MTVIDDQNYCRRGKPFINRQFSLAPKKCNKKNGNYNHYYNNNFHYLEIMNCIFTFCALLSLFFNFLAEIFVFRSVELFYVTLLFRNYTKNYRQPIIKSNNLADYTVFWNYSYDFSISFSFHYYHYFLALFPYT